MKKLILIIGLVSIVSSCKKESVEPTSCSIDKNSIVKLQMENDNLKLQQPVGQIRSIELMTYLYNGGYGGYWTGSNGYIMTGDFYAIMEKLSYEEVVEIRNKFGYDWYATQKYIQLEGQIESNNLEINRLNKKLKENNCQ